MEVACEEEGKRAAILFLNAWRKVMRWKFHSWKLQKNLFMSFLWGSSKSSLSLILIQVSSQLGDEWRKMWRISAKSSEEKLILSFLYRQLNVSLDQIYNIEAIYNAKSPFSHPTDPPATFFSLEQWQHFVCQKWEYKLWKISIYIYFYSSSYPLLPILVFIYVLFGVGLFFSAFSFSHTRCMDLGEREREKIFETFFASIHDKSLEREREREGGRPN